MKAEETKNKEIENEEEGAEEREQTDSERREEKNQMPPVALQTNRMPAAKM